jgi:hypothetical protein
VSSCFGLRLKLTLPGVLMPSCFGFAVVIAPATLDAGEVQNRTTVLLHQLQIISRSLRRVRSTQRPIANSRKEPIEGRECSSSAPTISYSKRGSPRPMSPWEAQEAQLQKLAKSIMPF